MTGVHVDTVVEISSIYIYICIHTYISMLQISRTASTHTVVKSILYSHTYVYVYIYICIYTYCCQIYFIFTHICICVYIYMYMYTYIFINATTLYICIYPELQFNSKHTYYGVATISRLLRIIRLYVEYRSLL